MIDVQENEVRRICKELLSDCYLTIDFNSIPFSVTLVFISNIERKKVVVQCNAISSFRLDKNADEYPFYSIFETNLDKKDGEWIIHILPEIDLTIVSTKITMSTGELSDSQLIEYGLLKKRLVELIYLLVAGPSGQRVPRRQCYLVSVSGGEADRGRHWWVFLEYRERTL
ncbi:hypothetical protein [Candidatus Thiodiazotropha sp. CDECU1]|uniref:hypothetical protein n=1 Tax=Candidatus Thiodiazotropha sp. CDECU1 TaxID=3065865 RepID=UPI00292D10A5|nr:hypothetical protein [Candidatus Thiodiazotropha sp. CDECU1]